MNTYQKLFFCVLSVLASLTATTHTMAPTNSNSSTLAENLPSYPLSEKFKLYQEIIKKQMPITGQMVRNKSLELGETAAKLKLEEHKEKRRKLRKEFEKKQEELSQLIGMLEGKKMLIMGMEKSLRLSPTSEQNKILEVIIHGQQKAIENEQKISAIKTQLDIDWNAKNGQPNQAEYRTELLQKAAREIIRIRLQTKDLSIIMLDQLASTVQIFQPKTQQQLADDKTSAEEGLHITKSPHVEQMLDPAMPGLLK